MQLLGLMHASGWNLSKYLPTNDTPLTYAVAMGDVDLVKFLLQVAWVDRTTRSLHPHRWQKTAAKIAKDSGHIEIQDLLGSPSGFNQKNFVSPILPESPLEPIIPSEILHPNFLKSGSALCAIQQKLKKAKDNEDLWLIFSPEKPNVQWSKTSKYLTKAFHKLTVIVHPDKNFAEREQAEKIFRAVSAAKDKLLTPP